MAKDLTQCYNEIEQLLRESRDAAREECNDGLLSLMIAEPIIKTCNDITISVIVQRLQSEEFRNRFKRDC